MKLQYIVIGCIIAVSIFNIAYVILEILDYKRNKIVKDLVSINRKIRRENKIRESYLIMIVDKCYDYDGYNTVKGLKDLIDDIDYYARLGRDCIDDEVCYRDIEGNLYNILDEKINNKE